MTGPHSSGNPDPLVQRKSLATQLTWVSILMVALAVVAVGTGLIVIAHRTQREAAFQMQRQSAEQVAQLISDYMNRAIDRLPFFLEVAQLTSQSPDRQKAAMETFLIASLPLYNQVTLLDRNGNESIKVSRFYTFLPKELMNQNLSPAFITAIKGGVYVGPVVFLSNEGILSVPVALPVKTPSARIVGVILAEVNVTHLWHQVARVKVGESGYAYLVDKDGCFVAYQKPAEVLQRYGEDMRKMPPVSDFIDCKAEGTGEVQEYRGLNDEEVIGVYSPIKGTDWAVVVEQPTREAYASISQMERYLLGIMALCILLAGGMGFYVSRRLIGPIRVLTDAAQRLATGDLDSDVREFRREDEVGILSRAFKKMQKELQDLYAGQKRKIEELETAHKALLESEEKYRTILESIEDGYYEVDLAGHFTFVNDSLCDIYGYSREELMGTRIGSLTDGEVEERGYAVFNKVYATGIAEKGFSWLAIRKDGAKKSVEASVSLKRDAEGAPIGFRGIVRDVSEKQRLEAQLQHAQRMESIGTLAGGIAHNFNNLLMGIMGYSSLMLMETASDHPNYDRLKKITKQVESGAKLTRQLLGYAREGSYEIRPINLNRLVKETSDTFGMTRKDITVHHDFYDGLHGIKADQGQIEQVLLNLYINAADAMPGGGDLFLKSRNVTHKDMNGEGYEMKPGEYVFLSVRDTGAGMKREVRERIFEPFFTTKGLAQGTGLGLASVYGIIKAHGGYINVFSEEGQGATFHIYLPAIEGRVEDNPEASEGVVKGQGTVLLVDDEQIVIEAAEEMLKRLGYEVLSAENGQEAVDIYRKNHERIDMILLDMVMPAMGGGEAFDRIREVDPKAKVLLSSGYSLEGEAKEIMKRGCNAFIQKPFNLDQLSCKMREVLGRKE
jgi:PAS domain S-box-containing protein